MRPAMLQWEKRTAGCGSMENKSAKSGYDREHLGVIRKIRIAAGALVLLLVAFGLLLGFAVIRDDGMRPDYQSGRAVVYLRFGRDFRRGDTVVLRLPDGNASVRRVVATSGDSVELRDGIAYINGLSERGNYSFTRTDPRPDGPGYPVILRAGEYFVLGDAREDAVDSRAFGVVREDDILGRPLR